MESQITPGDIVPEVETNELDASVVDDEYAGVREELERVIGDDAFPADKDALRSIAIDNGADDGTIRFFERLPKNVEFNSVQEMVEKTPTHRPS